MQRDGLLADASDVGFLAARKAKKNECLPTIVYKNKPLQQGEEFLPDELLVKVRACVLVPHPKEESEWCL